MINLLKAYIKKGVLLTIMMWTIANMEAKAQDYYGSSYDARKVVMGITFSPNISWLHYGDQENISQKAQIGYGYGLLADFRISQNYYFATGFLINNLKAHSDFVTQGDEVRYHLQYVEVPFGLKLKSTQRYYRSYYGQFGFTGGVRISGKEQIEGQGKADLGDRADIFRLGLQIGGGIDWQLDHKLNMITGLSYNNGFTSVLKEGKPTSAYLAFNFAIVF